MGSAKFAVPDSSFFVHNWRFPIQRIGTRMSAARPRVYIETTVVSYLTAWPSRNPIVLGHQQLTHVWWKNYRPSYELCISESVRKECEVGDPFAAQERLDVLNGMVLLNPSDESARLASELLAANALPAVAETDALHIAIAAVWQVPYLLTWNMRHMNNPRMRPLIERVCTQLGYHSPIICSPAELQEVTI